MATITRLGRASPHAGSDAAPGSPASEPTDEDAVTLGIEAGRAALNGRFDVGCLAFASGRPPLGYGTEAPFVREVLGLPESTVVHSLGRSDRAGIEALRVGCTAVEAGRANSALVVAGEGPATRDGSGTAAAGAAALVEPDGTGGVDLGPWTSRSRPLLESWAAPGGPRRDADRRFAREVGYVDTTARAVDGVLEAAGWAPDDVDALVVGQPNPGYPRRLADLLGLELALPDFAAERGNLGAASTLGVLARADLSSGDRLVVAAFGSGAADAVAGTVEDVPVTAGGG